MILIDFTHLFYRNLFMNIDKIANSENFLYHVIIQDLLFYGKKFQHSKDNRLVIACDNGSWRRKFFKENKNRFPEYQQQDIGKYKGTRKRQEIPFSYKRAYEIMDDTIEKMDKWTNFVVIKVENAEADDVIAVLTKNLKEEPVVIVSSDKDFKQLFRYRDDLIIYDPIKKKEIRRRDVVNPDFFLKKHIIMGDRIDGILPIKKRCGEKTAEKMVKDIDKILALNPDMKERYEFNEVLISFDKIPEEIEKAILDEWYKKKDTFNYNEMDLMMWLSSKSLKQHVKNIKLFKEFRQFEMPKRSYSLTDFI